MEINKRNIRVLSLLGHRGTFSQAMLEMADEGRDICVMAADLADLTGLEKFKTNYPERFFNIGIAEQNMVGVAAGLSRYGSTVYITTYANFLTMRPYEQIRMNLGYMKHNVKLIGTGAGLSMGMSGNSHFGLEDMSLMRSIPNMIVISPSDCTEMYKAIRAVADYQGPAYIRLGGPLNHPIVYKDDYKFEIGKAVELKDGKDIVIISTGMVTSECMKAADIIEDKTGLSVAVINMHTIKPIDRNVVLNYATVSKLMVTVEEHSIIGGLGGAVSDILSELGVHSPLLKIGLPDAFSIAGDAEFLAIHNRLKADMIAENIIKKVNSNG